MMECIEFEGYKDKRGYGTKKYKGKVWKAHRLAYTLFHGEIPEGLCVRHKCDNPSCINVEHLELGTHADNMGDMKQRGRAKTQKGSTHKLSKLTEADVVAIRKSTDSTRSLAKQYGVSQTTLSDAKAGRTWTHIKEA